MPRGSVQHAEVGSCQEPRTWGGCNRRSVGPIVDWGARIIETDIIAGEWVFDKVLVDGEVAQTFEVEAGVNHYYYWEEQYVVLSDGTITGYDGCNPFWGSYASDLVGHFKIVELEATLEGCLVQVSIEGETTTPILEYNSERFMAALLEARRVDVVHGYLHLWSEGPPEVEIVFRNRYRLPE